MVTDETSDGALLESAHGGDYGAFEVLVERYRDRIYRLARAMTRDDVEAEEVVQDACLSIFRNLGQFRRQSAVASWIYRIATNAALMRLRRKKRKPLLSIEDHGHGGMAASKTGLWPQGTWQRRPDDALLDQELQSQIEGAMQRLPEGYRLVLLLRDVEGMTNDEAAAALGLTVPTVKARLHRARLAVRQALDDYFHDKTPSYA